MYKFNFDNIEADSLFLEFTCEFCDKLNETEKMQVPEVDIDRPFKYISLQYSHRCQCGQIFPIKLFNRMTDGYGEINGLSENSNLHINEVPYIEHSPKTILVDAIEAIFANKQIADDIQDKKDKNENYILNMLFVNMFSILDSFVKISIYHLIINNTVYLQKCTQVFNNKDIQKMSFQSRAHRKKLFEGVFNIVLEYDDKLDYYLKIRNLIVHRNSLSPKGYKYKVTRDQIADLSNIIEKHIGQIHCELLKLRADKYSKSVI